MLTTDRIRVINIWSVDEGVWSSGMTEVSKTFSGGSIPSTPGQRSLCMQTLFLSFFRMEKNVIPGLKQLRTFQSANS